MKSKVLFEWTLKRNTQAGARRWQRKREKSARKEHIRVIKGLGFLEAEDGGWTGANIEGASVVFALPSSHR